MEIIDVACALADSEKSGKDLWLSSKGKYFSVNETPTEYHLYHVSNST